MPAKTASIALIAEPAGTAAFVNKLVMARTTVRKEPKPSGGLNQVSTLITILSMLVGLFVGAIGGASIIAFQAKRMIRDEVLKQTASDRELRFAENAFRNGREAEGYRFLEEVERLMKNDKLQMFKKDDWEDLYGYWIWRLGMSFNPALHYVKYQQVLNSMKEHGITPSHQQLLSLGRIEFRSRELTQARNYLEEARCMAGYSGDYQAETEAIFGLVDTYAAEGDKKNGLIAARRLIEFWPGVEIWELHNRQPPVNLGRLYENLDANRSEIFQAVKAEAELKKNPQPQPVTDTANEPGPATSQERSN